jgi:hypothetical protein
MDETKEIKNPPPVKERDIYMDGLVSTGNKFPNTILEIIFINQKIFPNYFINILIVAVDKRTVLKQSFDDLHQSFLLISIKFL